jgi:hypothetical protein
VIEDDDPGHEPLDQLPPLLPSGLLEALAEELYTIQILALPRFGRQGGER